MGEFFFVPESQATGFDGVSFIPGTPVSVASGLLVEHSGNIPVVQDTLLELAIGYEGMARSGELTPTSAQRAVIYAEGLFSIAVTIGT